MAVLSPISQKTDNKLIDASPLCPLLLFPVTEGLTAALTAEIPSLDPKQRQRNLIWVVSRNRGAEMPWADELDIWKKGVSFIFVLFL